MHMRLVIEFGSDVLSGDAVVAVRREVMRVVSLGIGASEETPGLREGSFQVGVPGSVFPVEVWYKTQLLGPDSEKHQP